MVDRPDLGAESSAVQLHLRIVQGVIGRMADSSRSCKVWCAALVSAVLVLVARTDGDHHALIALIPALALAILDARYLALERKFRDAYDGFVQRLHGGALGPSELYVVDPPLPIGVRRLAQTVTSFSVWLFHGPLVVLIFAAWLLLWLLD